MRNIFYWIIVLLLLGFLLRGYFLPIFFSPTASVLPEEKTATFGEPRVIAENLEIPWEIAFLPTGEMLVTERPGRLLKIGEDRKIIEVEGVEHVGEGGLLGLAVHPDFPTNGWVYLYLTTKEGAGLVNRVERYVLDGEKLRDKKILISDIPGASHHDGGRIAFGPTTSCESGQADCFLHITTGDAGNESSAQDIKSLAGKILRITDEGEIPNDNPFGNAIYSYGHRNSQGLAWDEAGNLWATEHGRSGAQSGYDELNLITKGGNYGWPESEGERVAAGTVGPVVHSGSSETWAPGGMAYLNGSLYFAGLRGESLYQAKLGGTNKVNLSAHLRGTFGRLRTATVGPGGLYILTSNRDGRGSVNPGDDKIILLPFSKTNL
jgi:glucose/arabinose dehydrogenase